MAWRFGVGGLALLAAILTVAQVWTGPSPNALVYDDASLRAPSWLLGGDSGSERRAIVAHERDPNFPAESRSMAMQSEGLRSAPSRPGARAIRMPSVSPPLAAAQSSARRQHEIRRVKVQKQPHSANDEWQMDRARLEHAVDMFGKYGDAALEKLVPKSQTERLYRKALVRADGEIALLKRERRSDVSVREGEREAVARIAAQLHAQAHKEGRGSSRTSAMAEQEAAKVEEEVREREQRSKEAVKQGSKVAKEISEVPATGTDAQRLYRLRETIKRMQSKDEAEVMTLKTSLKDVQRQAKGLAEPSPAAKGGGSVEQSGWTKPSASHPQSEIVYLPQSGRKSNAHVSEEGYAHTDSSLACEPCDGGEGCHAGCRVVSSRVDRLASGEDAESRRAREEKREDEKREAQAHTREEIRDKARAEAHDEEQARLVEDQKVRDGMEKERELEATVATKKAEVKEREEKKRQEKAADTMQAVEAKEEEEKQQHLVQEEKAQDRAASQLASEEAREDDVKQKVIRDRERAADAEAKREAAFQREEDAHAEQRLLEHAKRAGVRLEGRVKAESALHKRLQSALVKREQSEAKRGQEALISHEQTAVLREKALEQAEAKHEEAQQQYFKDQRKVEEKREAAMAKREQDEEHRLETEEAKKRTAYAAREQRDIMRHAEYDREHAPTVDAVSEPARRGRQTRVQSLPAAPAAAAAAAAAAVVGRHARGEREVTKEGIDLAGWLGRQEDEASDSIKRFAHSYTDPLGAQNLATSRHASSSGDDSDRSGWWDPGETWNAITSVFARGSGVDSKSQHLTDEGVNVYGRDSPGPRVTFGGDDAALPRMGVRV